jgi:3-deoxy-D-manno-octulosonate 8-phosphate phosphatase (KDO 8-P phosphatase)
MKHLYLGVKDKRAYLSTILKDTGRTIDQVAYIGDDVNDLGIIQALEREGITAAPSDAISAVAAAVHFVCTHRGGHGAFREFADWLLALRSPTTRRGRHQAKQR